MTKFSKVTQCIVNFCDSLHKLSLTFSSFFSICKAFKFLACKDFMLFSCKKNSKFLFYPFALEKCFVSSFTKHFIFLLKYKGLLFNFSFKIVKNDPSSGSCSGTMTFMFSETECFLFTHTVHSIITMKSDLCIHSSASYCRH